MKKLAQVVEVENEGFTAALGEKVLIFGMRYIYAGILAGVNQSCIKLEKAKIVYETGDFKNKDWANAEEPKSSDIYIQLSAIESWVTYK